MDRGKEGEKEIEGVPVVQIMKSKSGTELMSICMFLYNSRSKQTLKNN